MGIQYRSISKAICKEVVAYCSQHGIIKVQGHIDMMRSLYPFGKKDAYAYRIYVTEMERAIKRIMGEKYNHKILKAK